MIRWTGLAPWEFEFLFSGRPASTPPRLLKPLEAGLRASVREKERFYIYVYMYIYIYIYMYVYIYIYREREREREIDR